MIKVDFEETIRKGKLSGSYSPIFSGIFTCAVSGMHVCALYLFQPAAEAALLLRLAYGFVLVPLALGFIVFNAYKNFKESRLFTIPSSLPPETNKLAVDKYIDEEEMYVDYREGNYLIATKRISLKRTIQISVIFQADTILLNVLCRRSGGLGIGILNEDIDVRNDIAYEIRFWGKEGGAYLEP